MMPARLPLFAFASPGAAQQWGAVNDGVMGGVSDGRFRITEEGTLEFHGTLSLANDGGFVSVRSRPRDLGLEAGDSLVARVRGDGREYQLNLYTATRRVGSSYRAPLPTRAGEWIEACIPLDGFVATAFGQVRAGAGPVDPGSVTSVGLFLADGAPGPFRLEVAWIDVLRDPDRAGARTLGGAE